MTMHAELLDKIGDRRVIASVSGGKDSTATCLHLRELGVPYTAVYMDTGWESAETYRYLREELPGYIGPITWLRCEVPLKPDLEAIAALFEIRLGHPSPMVRWILKKGMFPSAGRRFCTTELKVRPMSKFLDALDSEAVNAVGIRADESEARRDMAEWEQPGSDSMIDAEVWRPLIRWTVDDVIAIHQRHAVTPNRSYFGGARRVGCWPCVRAAKKEIQNLADNDPTRIGIIRDLEDIVAGRAEARAEARGTTLADDGSLRPAWFQSPIRYYEATGRMVCSACRREWGDGAGHENCDGDGHGGSEMAETVARWPTWPIDKVVEWSRTAFGGRQVELFAAKPHELGCMRWGMCDLPSGKGDE